jgi:hypothetical protein
MTSRDRKLRLRKTTLRNLDVELASNVRAGDEHTVSCQCQHFTFTCICTYVCTTFAGSDGHPCLDLEPTFNCSGTCDTGAP